MHPSVLTRAVALAALMALAAVGNAQNIKIEKYELPNGMKVILHEDHALPTAVVNIWYRVGAQDEPPGRSGFAHLFEHLMFMGTKRVPGSEFDTLMETGGGANNASTDLHRTNYFSWGPSKLLPTLLWLDADRLEDMGLNMTQEKLDKQRAIVRNELRQMIENTPYGKAEEYISRLMYPAGHPYHIGTAGLHEDLEAATVTNVKDFFANFYVPNNASLVVAGDFNPAEIKPLIEKLFGSLPRGGDVKQRDVPPATLDRIVRYTMIDKVQLPKIMMSWHSPRGFQDGDAEMQLAADVLASGKTSRLYKRLVYDEKIAIEVDASQSSFPLGSIFKVDVLTKPDADLDKIEKIVDEELARFCKEGPTAAELEERKTTTEMRKLSSLQSLLGRADQLNEYAYFWNEPNSFERDLERYRKAAPEAVKNWAAKVITPNARAVVRVLPEEPQRPESGRDKRPDALAASPFAPPAPETFTLKNGLPVMLWKRPELPLVSLSLSIRPGGALDPAGKAGLTALAAQMLEEGAGDRGALEFSQALQSLGASFGAGADHESIGVSLSVLKRNFDKAAALAADAVRRPKMDAKEWERVRTIHLEELEQADEEPNQVAAKVGARILFGDSNPYSQPGEGTIESVKKLTLDDIKAAHTQFVQPANAALFIAGDISADEARAILEKHLGDWKAAANAPSIRAFGDHPFPIVGGMKVAIVHRPEAVQTVIRYLAPGVPYSDGKRMPLRLLNTILGGSFTSRLNANLREDKGYTYGARSSWNMEISAGYFSAAAAVRTDVTGASLKEFMTEFGRLAAGDITDAEATKARETVRQNMVRSFEGLRGLLGVAVELWDNKLPFETLAKDLASIENTTAADLNALSKSAIALDRGVLVLVGDRSKILEQLKELNLPKPQEYDANGEPAKQATANE